MRINENKRSAVLQIYYVIFYKVTFINKNLFTQINDVAFLKLFLWCKQIRVDNTGM